MNLLTTNKQKKKSIKISSKKFLNIILLVLAVLYCAFELYNQIFTMTYSLLLGFIVVIYLAIGLLVEKWWGKSLVIILLVGLCIGQFYPQFTLNRLVASTNNKQYQYASVVVLKDSPVEAMSDLKNQQFEKSSFLTEELFKSVTDKYPDIIKSDKLLTVSDDIELIKDLYNKKTAAIVINEINRSYILEKFKDFEEKTKVIDKAETVKVVDNSSKMQMISDSTFSMLISGIDTFGSLSTVSRSDVNIVMIVNKNKKKILTVAIPRDTYVYVPCIGGYDKLTHSGIYGISCTQETIAGLIKTPLNYYARLNFSGFGDIVNVVGNIDVNSHYEFVGYLGTQFKEGINTLDAERALEFARTRYTVAGGDYTRGVHQQEVIKATFNKLISSIKITNIESIVSAIKENLDTNFDGNLLNTLIKEQLSDGASWEFEMMSLSGEGALRPTALYPNQNLWVSYPNEQKLQEIIEKIEAMK